MQEEPHSAVPATPAWVGGGDPPLPAPSAEAEFDGVRWPGDADRTEDRARLRRLMWVFALLTALLLAPSVIGRIQYALTAAQERARLDVARANLTDFKLGQISAAYRMLAQSVGPSVVSIRTQLGRVEGQGSGVVVDPAGYIITNNHVVDQVQTVEIELSDGRRRSATVIGIDPLTDIAVLKTDMNNLVAAEWGDSDELQVGDIVWALGSPFGLRKSITFGILSAKERRGITEGVMQEYLQTDAAVNPGNSGGPLVNYEGKVVGINTAIIGQSYLGISFAVPSELARASYEQIRDQGYVLRGFVGITPAAVPDEVARELDIDLNEGVLVAHSWANTPASDAGLQQGDVILRWNDEEFNDPTLLSRAIAGTPIGSDVKVKIVRDTPRGPRELELEVRVAARPPETNRGR
jgi:serine protease Do